MKRLDVEIEIAKIDEKLRVRTDEVCAADGCIYEDAEINDLESKKRRLKAQLAEDNKNFSARYSYEELVNLLVEIHKKEKMITTEGALALTIDEILTGATVAENKKLISGIKTKILDTLIKF